MNREDFYRVMEEIQDIPINSNELVSLALNFKQVEVLEEISEYLKSMVSILSGLKKL